MKWRVDLGTYLVQPAKPPCEPLLRAARPGEADHRYVYVEVIEEMEVSMDPTIDGLASVGMASLAWTGFRFSHPDDKDLWGHVRVYATDADTATRAAYAVAIFGSPVAWGRAQEPMDIEAIMARCPECSGRTVEFRGRGLDLQHKVCSRYREPGHKSEDAVRAEIGEMRNHHAPASGRYG